MSERHSFAIVSDLHVYDQAFLEAKEEEPSFLKVAPGSLPDPLTTLESLIRREQIRADALLCPGDLCDKAQPTALEFAWRSLLTIKGWLGASCLCATAGNHDVDSRHVYTDHDARGALLDLSPAFPVEDPVLCNEYWANRFTIVPIPRGRIVVLDSSAYHGFQDEHQHGRVARRTLERLKQRLAATTPPPLNVLLCHHHPEQHEELRLGDYDTMKQGQLLVDLLGSGSFGRWMIVHGHKHHPKISYGKGTATSPVIFSAGSFSRQLLGELGTEARNQFYVVDLEINQSGALRGNARAWSWGAANGWRPAQSDVGIPARSGFGCREDPEELAQRIATIRRGAEAVDWKAIEDCVSGVRHLLPSDYHQVRKALKERHSLEVLELDGVPVQIGSRP